MLWIPGPTEVRPEILAECARPQISHRGKEMDALSARIDPHLRLAFGLAESSNAQVAVHTCSGTGLMEAALHGVGPRTLHLVNGAFSKRWHEVALALGKSTTKLEAPLGETVAPEAVERALAEQGPFDAVTLTVNETATGVRTPLGSLARALRAAPDTLFLADLVSYLGGAPVDFDAHGLDFAFASSQKALSLPPGVAVCSASTRYLDRARKSKRASFYLDPIRIIDGHRERATIATPCLPLYFALARQLEDISAGATLPPSERGRTGADAWSARFAKHVRMQAATVAWALGHGLALLPVPELASPTVSCLRRGALDVEKLTKALAKRGELISNGYGELKGHTFRIGHMGDHDETALARLLVAIDELWPTVLA
ncbi:MAG: alanine--glyoxylate aminotransferase family protein [Planctomycetes bacterium]|nr:alanine--glyoxylate aminotransferase family protein [Planctomycetota bacterium]